MSRSTGGRAAAPVLQDQESAVSVAKPTTEQWEPALSCHRLPGTGYMTGLRGSSYHSLESRAIIHRAPQHRHVKAKTWPWAPEPREGASQVRSPNTSPTQLHLPASSLERHRQHARVGIDQQEGRNLSFHLWNHSMSNMSDPQLGRSSRSCPAAACSQEIQNDWFDSDIWNQSQFKPQNQRNAGENIEPLSRKYPNRTQHFQAQLFLMGNQKF